MILLYNNHNDLNFDLFSYINFIQILFFLYAAFELLFFVFTALAWGRLTRR